MDQFAWDVFICHASEDKETVARPLSNELIALGLKVWLDETEIRLGDSLRTKIDSGLAHSRFGVVILSPQFFAKQWTKSELDGLIAREADGRKVILPIWNNLTSTEVARFSPMLAGRFAINTSEGLPIVAKEILYVVTNAEPALAQLRGKIFEGRQAIGEPFEIPCRLLQFIWSYPLLGEVEASWAVKESAVLLGKLGTAREQPGSGISMITTELASLAFATAADSRVDGSILWNVSRTECEPPYRVLAEVRDPSSYAKVEMRPDLRHTFAFGVVLARFHKQYGYLKCYLQLAVDTQEVDGGWPAESAGTISPVFTAIYAIELLYLALSESRLPNIMQMQIRDAMAGGLGWLRDNCKEGLWSSGVLREFSWDRVCATAWVLHRLALTAEMPVEGWKACLDNAQFKMIEAARNPTTWLGSSEAQRYRIEARVVAAARRMSAINRISDRSREAALLYIGAWSARAENWVRHLNPDQLDLATATFLIWSLIPETQFAELGRVTLASHSA